MILTLFGFLVVISIVLIVLGLARPSESAQALIGFIFLFLLSTSVLMTGNLQYETGSHINTTVSYDGSGNVVSTNQDVTYDYTSFNDSLSRRMGLYLSIASAIGFAGVLFALRRTRKEE